MYPSGSALAPLYGTPKMHKFFSSDSFPKLYPSFSSIGIFNCNLARFLCDVLSSLALMVTLAKTLFLLFLKSKKQIFPESFLFPTM